MVTLADCPCGKTGLSSAQMTMHNRSKAHKEWAEANGEVVEVVDRDFEGILEAARQGEDVRHVAKMVRSIFRARGGPTRNTPKQSVTGWSLTTYR